MGSALSTCYLVDGQGMELHLRRQHPSWQRQAGGCWKNLNDQGSKSAHHTVEIRLLAAPAWPEAAAFSQPGQTLERVAAEPRDFAAWMKRDARRRKASCIYVLVSEDPELRREARGLGLPVLDHAELLRRLGLAGLADPALLEKTRERAPKDPSILKGGKVMGEAELRWWKEQLQLPEEAEAATPAARREEEDRRLERLLGAEEDDPRILDHGDEQWMERNFPDQPGEGRPRRPPKARKR